MKHFIFISLFFLVLDNCYTQDLNDTSNLKNDSVYIGSNKDSLEEPGYIISSSTLALSGSSKVVATSNGTYYVSQSIGQTSVIGTKINKNYTILQGYQLSSISVIRESNIENELKATVYPNPFDESIHISFDDVTKEEILIHVFDMTGRLLMAKRYPPGQILNIQLDYISAGIYNLNVNADNKQFVAKIIKK